MRLTRKSRKKIEKTKKKKSSNARARVFLHKGDVGKVGNLVDTGPINPILYNIYIY